MLTENQIAATLKDPSDRLGWDRLLAQENLQITSFLARLGYRYGVPDVDLADVKQIALIRRILESRRLNEPAAFRSYWQRILRSSLFDFLRANRLLSKEVRGETSEQASASTADSSVRVREVAQFIEGKSRLMREVGRGLLVGESARETARRLGTTEATVYATRVRIRSGLKEL